MTKQATALLATLLLLPLATTIAHGETMKPGQWEITSENQIEGAAMPAMPAISPDQLAKMQAKGIKMPGRGGKAMSFTVRHCVTKEQAEKGIPPQPKNVQHCEQKSVKREGNKISWTIECTGEHPVSGIGSIVFDSPKHYQGNSVINMKDPILPMTMKQSYSGKWLSATCEKQ